MQVEGEWRSDQDLQTRMIMIGKITHLIHKRKPSPPQRWLKKIPQMAKRLELSLYRSARSFQEYSDESSLKQRLQKLAIIIVANRNDKLEMAQILRGKKHQQKYQLKHINRNESNRGWQSFQYFQNRKIMISKIAHLIRKRKPNPSRRWLKKLPQMAKRLEMSIYRSASSQEVYIDESSLKQRLQKLALRMLHEHADIKNIYGNNINNQNVLI